MDTTEQSLANAFSEFTKGVPTVEEPIVETVQSAANDNAEGEEIIATDSNKEIQEVVPGATGGTEEEEIDAIKQFAEALGYTGEIKGDDLDTLISIANAQISQYKEKSESYENNKVIKELSEYILAGGTLEDFFSSPQETNNFQDLVLAEDAIEDREQLLAYYFKEIKGVDDEEIELLVNSYKEKGTFNTQSDKALLALKTMEANSNAEIVNARQAEIKQSQQNLQKFVADVDNSFKEGFNGVTVDPTIIAKAKALSLPNAQGQFEINNTISNLSVKHQAILNVFATALNENKKFSFDPTAAVMGNKPKPINQLLGKAKGGGKEVAGTMNDFNNILIAARKNNTFN